MAKKRCIDDVLGVEYKGDAEDAVGLPAELWAKTLEYLHFDDVLACIAISKFFLNDVSKQIRYLFISSGESMNIAPASTERFMSVEYVQVKIIKEIAHRSHLYHVDSPAMQCLVPFLTRLPKLSFVTLESFIRHCYLIGDFDRHKSDYDDPCLKEKYADLIQSVCGAYRTGALSKEVEFEGLLGCRYDRQRKCLLCPWKSIPKIGDYRADVACQICDMICMSYPPSLVLDLDDYDVPCITTDDRIRIAKVRDESAFKSNLTEKFLSLVENPGYMPVMCPPDFVTRHYALHFEDHRLDMIQSVITHGATVDYPEITKYLMGQNISAIERSPEWTHVSDDAFLGTKRIFAIDTFNKLKDIGFDINEYECVLIDLSDERTSYADLIRRTARDKLKSGTAFHDVEEIRDKIKDLVSRDQYHEREMLYEIKKYLQWWLGRGEMGLDSYEQHCIRRLVEEFKGNK